MKNMKRLLRAMAALGFVSASASSVVACNIQQHQKIDIKDKIESPINLEQLSNYTLLAFKTALQGKLITIQDLNTISISDYDVYKAGAGTIAITDSDIASKTTINIKIVAKGDNFTGIVDNITINYTKSQQDTIYRDSSGHEQTTSDRDLLNLKTTEIIQIGFYQNEKKQIQAVRMPKTVETVPATLPPQITSLESIFSGAQAFNQDISNWDTSHVTDMRAMFVGAIKFNQNISSWNTSHVTDMSYMFGSTTAFDGNISDWKTSNVTTMEGMFAGASKFNQNISDWKTSNVEIMKNMFNGATAFNGNISDWKTSNVTTMEGMFAGASKFNQNISDWKTSNVEIMKNMFNGATAFNQNLSKWNVGNVTNHIDFSTDSGITDPNMPDFNRKLKINFQDIENLTNTK